MRVLCSTTALFFFCIAPLCVPAQESADDYQPLFNGRDLDGWVAVNTAPSTWRVDDGMLICSGKPIGELRTERMYQNFILEVEWRHMVPKGNAGIFVWADDITARGQPFHRSIEVQVLENAYGNSRGHTTHGDIFPIHGATMTPINGRGGSRAFPIENLSRPSPEWNHYRITCLDGNIALEVNGKLVTQGRDCSPKKGYICLESEGGIVHYRNLRIKELPATPIDDADIAIANRDYKCLYTGVDFSGWQLTDAAKDQWKSRDWVFSCDGTGAKEACTIQTTKEYLDFGFILDVRPKESTKFVEMSLRGTGQAVIRFDPNDSELKELLGGGRGWHRIEGQVVGSDLSVTVNGQPWISNRRLEGTASPGPLTLQASGPVDFANPYVRIISPDTDDRN